MALLQPPFSWSEFTTWRVNPGDMPEYEVPRSRIVLCRMGDAHDIHVARFDAGSASRHRIPGVRTGKGLVAAPLLMVSELIARGRCSSFVALRSNLLQLLQRSSDVTHSGTNPRDASFRGELLPAPWASNIKSHGLTRCNHNTRTG